MKIAMIICYYGSLPAYFEAWAKTVVFNPQIEFFFITDIEYERTLPKNIRLIKMGFGELVERIEDQMGFPISLRSAYPYKLCDFKPTYGLIFAKELDGYDFFGNCDIDMAFGDLSKYISADILEKHEKIFRLGHFTLYKNNEKMRKLFMGGGGIWDYETSFQSQHITGFDEYLGVDLIARENKVKCYFSNVYADIATNHKKAMKAKNHVNYTEQVFYWENGKAMRAYINEGEVGTDEFMYIHWQKKNPVCGIDKADDCASFYIFPDAIVLKEKGGIPPADEIRKLSAKGGLARDVADQIGYYGGKVMSIAKMGKEERSVRMVQLKNREINKAFRRESYK